MSYTQPYTFFNIYMFYKIISFYCDGKVGKETVLQRFLLLIFGTNVLQGRQKRFIQNKLALEATDR